MSKSSRPRPLSVSPSEFDKNMDRIFGEKPKRERYVPPPLPDMTEVKKTIQWYNDETDNK
jgi:hypothetical protein